VISPELFVLSAIMVSQTASSSQVTVARERAVPASVVSADVGQAVAVGVATVEYERAVTPVLSLFAGPQVKFRVGPLDGTERWNETLSVGVGASFGMRVYLTSWSPRGLFFAVQSSLQWQRWDRQVYSPAATVPVDRLALAVGVMVGYQWFITRSATLSVGIGQDLVFAKEFAPEESSFDADGGAWPVRVAAGWAF
jgi:hypothetical protein